MGTTIAEPGIRRPVRLWPGIAILAVQLPLRYLLTLVMPGEAGTALLAGVAGLLLVLIWWLVFSRIPWRERLLGLLFMAVVLAVTYQVAHPSLATGMRGMMLIMHTAPLFSLALVTWAAWSERMAGPARTLSLAAGLLLACAVFPALRANGIRGDAATEFEWRWKQTAEEKLLATSAKLPPPAVSTPEPSPKPATAKSEPVAPPAPVQPVVRLAIWPGFRGPARDSVVRGVRIQENWASEPPKLIWRRPVGPGWSSFAVWEDRLFTQEQRGEEEVVACYNADTGEPVWAHSDPVRFWESHGGAGPRSTPTIDGAGIYALGATGILNVLDVRSGALRWSRNIASDTQRKPPGWGFSSSPVVVDGLVIVSAFGQLAAYEASSGKPRWIGDKNGGTYASPQLLRLHGVPQIVLLSGSGPVGVSLADGKKLWSHAWQGSPMLQPAAVAADALLATTSDGLGGAGTRRLQITRDDSGWKAAEVWTSKGLKPYFNDLVIHKDHVYGFDGGILSCIALADGQRKWKGGRYGHGQFLLLADQDLLLVLSEEGDIALVRAAPDGFQELARVPGIEGKTWNHPVLAGNRLFIRNAGEMAAFVLP